MRNLVSPDKPGDKSYDELVAALKKHFNPTPSEMVQRSKFHSRVRRPGETIAAFVADLRSLAEFCNFGSSLDDMLRDRIVCGVNNRKIQQTLLSEKTLTLKKALEVAQGWETAAKNAKVLSQGEASAESLTSEAVNRVGGNEKSRTSTRQKFTGTCFCCGKAGHRRATCRFKNAVCHGCGKTGHLKRVCNKSGSCGKQKGQSSSKPVHLLEGSSSEKEDEEENYHLYSINSASKPRPYKSKCEINGTPIDLEIDNGASLTLVSEQTFRERWPTTQLSTSDITLRSYTGESIPVLGCVDVNVKCGNQVATLPLVVVKGEGPSLLGRNWLSQLKLNWHEIFWSHNPALSEVLEKFKTVFEPGLGTVNGYKAQILVDSAARPKYFKARSVPYFYREKVEKELDRLVEEGTLEPVEHSEWAAPTVAVLKPDKQRVRICGDFKQTVNEIAKLDRYPIPRVEDLFAKLAGGKMFTKLDLSQAYLQVPLDDESKKYVVINTQKGLFRYTRLPYGISSAPGIFQRLMENLLSGISNVIVYIDDILISGATEEEHLKTLAQVLSRLEQAGLRVQKPKCEFMAPSVTYLGHMIDQHGLHPLQEKVKAVQDAPDPKNVSELKSYLGLLTYYSKFLPSMAQVLAPLYKLLRKDVRWRWSKNERSAFQASKELLMSSSLLVHFNPDLDLILMCDASSYGVGAVLAHRMPDGSERPIGYASRTLTAAQRNYSQLEKEALALVFGVQRFHSYLFGHRFELVTDHQPLLALLHEHRPTSTQASARVRRWSLLLSGYEYTIRFRNTKAHSNADALSRLPLPETQKETKTPPELVLLTDHLDDSPVTAHHIAVWTRRDPELSKVLTYVQRGWPNECDKSLSNFSSKRNELSIHQGCLTWGSRVVIPPQGREAVLQELHEGHPGMTKMKSLARMYVWWPNLEKDIESFVQSCHQCQEQQPAPSVAPLQPWRWPTRPWTRLHMDFAGPLNGKMILIVIDAHSKWIEAIPTESATSSVVIESSRVLFSQFGLPEVLVTDNGPCFVGEDFEIFLAKNGIKHITSAPYHPATNGLAERAVQTVKRGLKKVTQGSMKTRIAKILTAYRSTPQSTTGMSPAQLLMGRSIRTRLDLLLPNTSEKVENRQLQQKVQHDKLNSRKTFQKGEKVYARNFGTSSGQKWLPAVIEEVTGPVSFMCKLQDSHVVRRHLDHLRPRAVSETTTQQVRPRNIESEDDEPLVSPSAEGNAENDFETDTTTVGSDSTREGENQSPETPVTGTQLRVGAPPTTAQPVSKTYPKRNRKPPDWYSDHT